MDFESVITWIQNLLNTQVLVYGTTVLTIGHIIYLILRWILPNNKIITNQESTISFLEDENTSLKETNQKLIADVEKLKKQMDVVLTNSQNKKYRQAKNIEIAVNNVEALKTNITKLIRKTKKVKVKKGTNQNG